MQPLHPINNPYQVILPISIILSGISGIATTYCHSKEKEIIIQLDALYESLENDSSNQEKKLESEIIQKELEQKIFLFNTGKWFCGSMTVASFVAAVLSGIQLYRHSNQNQSTPKTSKQTKSTFEKKALLAMRLDLQIKEITQIDSKLNDCKNRLDKQIELIKEKQNKIKQEKEKMSQKKGLFTNLFESKTLREEGLREYEKLEKHLQIALARTQVGIDNDKLYRDELEKKHNKINKTITEYLSIQIDTNTLTDNQKSAFSKVDHLIQVYVTYSRE